MFTRGSRFRRLLAKATFVGALLGLVGGTFAAAPALADDFTAVLQITKTVNKPALVPNDTLVYTIAIDCSTDNCVGARLTDTLPPQFDALTLNTAVAVSGGPSTSSWGGTNNRTLTVDFTKPTAGGPGIPAGTGYSVQISLTVPSGLPADWPSNGVSVPNTAKVSATTAAEVEASVSATITVPYSVATTASATWNPTAAQYKVNDPSTLTLSTRNTSNAAATSLTLLAPTDPTAASSLFEYVNLTGFGAVTFPAGADRIQVDTYVGGVWINGPNGATAQLDGSVTPADVRGLRVTFTSSTGSTITASGAAGSVVLQLAQRASTRTAATSLISGATATANVTGTVLVPTQPARSTTASATYAIGALTSVVSATTSFANARVAAGTSTTAVLTGRNLSNGPLTTLTVTQPTTSALLDAKVTFAGFAATGVAWPSGATSATVTWFVDSGSAPAPSTVTTVNTLPATPTLTGGQRIIGFSVEFGGAPIAANATAAVPFTVAVAYDAVPASPGTLTRANTIRVDGVNDAGTATPATASANLVMLYPQIGVSMTKSVTPGSSTPVPPGGRSIVQLRATTSSDSGFVTPTSVTLSDVLTSSTTDYWRGFNVVGVAPTQVLAGSTLLVQYTVDGTTWVDLGGVTAGATATTYTDVFPTAVAPTIIGVRFLHTKASGFSQSSTLVGNLSFQSRATLRGTTDPTATSGSNGAFTNAATVQAVGDVQLPGGGTVSGGTSSNAAGGIVWRPAGSGGQLFDKNWQNATVDSQSGQTRVARLKWGTEIDGYTTAVVTDGEGDPLTTPVSATVFQTFNLQRLNPITTTTDPLIAFDQISDIELFQSGAWSSIKSTVCSPASNCQGKFTGYTLSTAQQTNTTAVRITFAEWAAGRTSSTDPLTPPVGSGVASSPTSRTLDLTFVIRNKVRDASAMADPTNPWVTGVRVYNATDPGVVSNSAMLTLGSHTATDSDTILIFDRAPAVAISKVAQNSAGATLPGPVAIPSPDDTVPSAYPVVKFSMTATNASTARAWYLRMTDQMPCSTGSISACAHPTVDTTGGWTVNPYTGAWDPTTSPFQYFTIEKVAYTLTSGSGISTGNSTITFWKADGTNETVALSSPKLTDTTYLADVVGVSALFASTSTTEGGTIVSGGGATIVLDTRLRKFLRNSSTTLISGTANVTNSAFAQDWDGVLDDTAAYGSASAVVQLNDAKIDVAVTKTFSAASLLEANRNTDITTTLHADQATATASATQVVVSDVDPAFWDAFELRSITSASMPFGADRVHVDVQLNGGTAWTAGTTVASNPALPAVTLADVTGLRVVFTRADGGLLSTTAPAAAWSTDILFKVRLRAALRDGGAITFPGSVANTATATVTHPALGTKTASASRSITLDPGTFRVDVEKRRSVATSPAGETLDFRLIFTNTGTGYLDNPVITDQLPIDAALSAGGPLLFDPTTETSYSTSTGGILPTTGVTVAYDDTTRRITFSWPSGSRLAPGESYTILVPLQIAPGLQAVYGNVVNRMTFASDRTLAACTNVSGNGEGVSAPTTSSCSTTARVQAVSASAISSFKGVKGDVDASGISTTGAVNVNSAATPCVADPEGFYRNPCAANTVVGGTDLWKVQYTNGGNVPATSATVVDVLPRPSDVYLGTGASRGSTYRPVFAGSVALTASGLASGVTLAGWDVTTTANPCPAFASNLTCTTATWTDSTLFSPTSYASVTALRFRFDFSAVTASPGTLPPAAVVTVNYETVNTPTSTAGDQRAPVTVPVTNQRAWNTFGVYATFGSGYTDRRVEPVRAGVQLASGPLQVTKGITGTGAAWAPTSFGASLACTVAGRAVVLGGSSALTLAATNGVPYSSRVDGIPVGSVCTITETTAGASSVAYSPASPSGTSALITVGTAAGSTAPVPSAQAATITNAYGTTTLTVTKSIATTATVGSFGPFDFALSCTVNTGTSTLTVPLASGDAAFTLADGGTRTITGLPVTAVCNLRETDSDGATTIGVAVDGGPRATVVENQAHAITLGTNAGYTADVRNTYSGGKLAVAKTVSGSGASYGTGPFTVEVECTYDGQTLYDGDVTLIDGQTVTLSPVFPVGTLCAVDETDAGGATTPAAGGSVLIPGPTGLQTVGLVTAGLTNAFEAGSLQVTKVRTGAAATYGDGPFQAQVVCTWDKPGASDQSIPLPDGGLVDLTSANGYTATVTGLIAGADCAVTETKSGGATSHSVGTVGAIPANGTATVTITNNYATGSLVIDKVRTGPGVAAFGTGPFEVSVDCTYASNGSMVAIPLGAAATQKLTAANGYTATVSGLLVGAECVVAETDPGLATSVAYTPGTGTVTIPPAGLGTANVTVNNDFQVGQLDLEKDTTAVLLQGGDTYDYTFVVKNVGAVDAAGVKIVDDLDPTLRESGIVSTGWASCAVTGKDGQGYGGQLVCELNDAGNPVLAVGATAPTVTMTVQVLPEIAQDDLVNGAEVSSTTIVVAGDDDTVTTPVKWLAVTATPQCIQDAPWLDYTVDAHNLDVSGRDMTVDWKDGLGNIIHTDTVHVALNGTISGSLLWPGAAVDAAGDGVAWPGWRAALPGETPTWENLILDPAAYGYGLRSGASIDVHLNPTTTVSVAYPAASATCEETPTGRMSSLWLDKSASTTFVPAGGEFDYTIRSGNDGLGAAEDVKLVDVVPDELRILSVTPAVPTDPELPAWTGCVITDRQANGYGGTITCDLDRPLGQSIDAPDVVLHVKLSPQAGGGPLQNIATLTGEDSPPNAAARLAGLSTFFLTDDAIIMTASALALTGVTISGSIQVIVWLLGLGIVLVLLARWRRRAAEDS